MSRRLVSSIAMGIAVLWCKLVHWKVDRYYCPYEAVWKCKDCHTPH